MNSHQRDKHHALLNYIDIILIFIFINRLLRKIYLSYLLKWFKNSAEDVNISEN